MTDEQKWNDEEPIARHEIIEVPRWIEQDISPSTVAAIVQGGCASGAYMPAVTYYDAGKTMAEHGDKVLQYLEDNMGELPRVPDSISWSALACHYLVDAVELWASSADSLLDDVEVA